MAENQQSSDKYAGAFNAMPYPAVIICGVAPAILNSAALRLLPSGGENWIHKLPGLSGYIAKRSFAEFSAMLPTGAACTVEIHPIQSGGVLVLLKPGETLIDYTSPENLPYKSKSMSVILERMGRMSLVSSSVLLSGEAGVGKEAFARAIHRRSLRSSKPFIKVDCRSPHPDKLEAVLFGHGGAPGTLEAVGDGVVYIDEIFRLPAFLKKKLTAVLQTHRLTKSDGGEIPLRARIMAASSRDLRQMAAEGEFPEELYLCVSSLTVDIPPLRDRIEDIMPIAEFVASRNAYAAGHESVTFSGAAATLMTAHSWPLNVRELVQTSASAVITCRDNVIEPPDLSVSERKDVSLAAMTAEFQRGRIRALMDVYGNTLAGKKEAARSLGIGLSTLYRLMAAEKT